MQITVSALIKYASEKCLTDTVSTDERSRLLMDVNEIRESAAGHALSEANVARSMMVRTCLHFYSSTKISRLV